jgi:hypothetical protein
MKIFATRRIVTYQHGIYPKYMPQANKETTPVFNSVFPGFVIGADAVAQAGEAGSDIAAIDRDLSAADKARFVRR